jgi:pyridinium-3,5-biscarboxylic acid mononucleotide sulfurtransferase
MSVTPESAQFLRIDEPAPRLHPDLHWEARLERLRALIASLGSVVVAYSGGVDSSVVLRAAHEVLGPRARGVIGRSDSYAARELALALEQAASFGAEVEVVTTGELKDENFRANPTDRCYHCKRELYRRLDEVARRTRTAAILDGTIHDDLTDWRPGRRAAAEYQVRSPLAELGFGKSDVRAAATYYGLSSRDKPASPCLASRIPYGTEITREILNQVERAEELLRSLGFAELRVRHHGEIARLEVAQRDMVRLLDPEVRTPLAQGLKDLGYRFVTLDLEGFRSGSLNGAAGIGGAVGFRPSVGDRNPLPAGPTVKDT